MNAYLWVTQIILGIKFITVAYTHGLRQDKATMQQAIQRLGPPSRPLLAGAAVVMFVASLGLILPAALGFLTWLTPFAATVLALMMGISILLHLKSREKPLVFADIILFVLCAFVAYGRWVIVP